MGSLFERTGTRPVGECPTRRLAGWLPSGMIDWPGRVSATLFLAGCSFACPYCHNPELRTLGRCRSEGWKPLVEHLRSRRDWIDGVVVTGGEPTEDPDLPSLLAALAEEDLPVKLDTNGASPDVLAHLIAEDLVAYVAMDVKTTWERYDEVARRPGIVRDVAESAGLLLSSDIPYEFRLTACPEVIALDEIARVASDLSGGRLLALQQFHGRHTLERRLGDLRPYSAEELTRLADMCSRSLPTIVRGIG